MEKIKERLQKLSEVEKTLKSEFIGIDPIIDRILESITPWYVTPEIITRPTVVSLWGLTGTGKTSVVKRIIDLLELTPDSLYFNCATEADNGKDSIDSKIVDFFEDENGNTKTSYSSDGVQVKTNSRRAIMIFDEFQNCRTLDEQGEERDRSQTGAIWQILDSGILESTEWSWEITRLLGIVEEICSLAQIHPTIPIKDGKFTMTGEELEQIDEGFHEYLDFQGLYNFSDHSFPRDLLLDDDLEEDPNEEGQDKKYPYTVPQNLVRVGVKRYNVFGHGEGWKERAKMRACTTLGEFSDLLMDYSKELSSPKRVDCSESLVFVIGNLDEAFGVNEEIDPDIDADILHKLTSNVTVTDVKNSLKKRFRLEQISRLGNNMILYPSLTKKDFSEIINLELSKITENFKKLSGFEIEFSDIMKDLIYSEAVYPVQGVRPIHSTISTLITPKLSRVLIQKPLGSKKAEISVETNNFEVPQVNLTVTYDTGDKVNLLQELVLGSLRDISQYSKIYLHAIHEAGHAVVYSVLTGKMPEIIVAITANGGGYMWRECDSSSSRRESETLEDIEQDTMVAYAGLLAERHFFGHSEKTSLGASSDIQAAYDNLAGSIYDCGYGYDLVKYRTPEGFPPGVHNQKGLTDGSAEGYLVEETRRLVKKTQKLIDDESQFIKDVALYLGKHRKMNKKTFKEFFQKYHPEVKEKTRDWYLEQIKRRLGE